MPEPGFSIQGWEERGRRAAARDVSPDIKVTSATLCGNSEMVGMAWRQPAMWRCSRGGDKLFVDYAGDTVRVQRRKPRTVVDAC